MWKKRASKARARERMKSRGKEGGKEKGEDRKKRREGDWSDRAKAKSTCRGPEFSSKEVHNGL